MGYEELEGKIVEYRDSNGETGKALIVGIDFDLGISMVNADRKEQNLVCVNGSSSPHGKSFIDDEKYKKTFDFIVSMCEKGYYSMDEFDMFAFGKVNHFSIFGGMESCPFKY